MPLVRIDLLKGRTPQQLQTISNAVHTAMIDSLQIPPDDRFQVITEHEPGGLVYDPTYLGITRTDRVIFIQITLSAGRKPAQKRRLYELLCQYLAANPGIRPEDVLVNLVETQWENWSFGKGDAPYTR